ncbi:hypothetical protein B5M09_003255 [Aphanomyces astaci]|uniref:DNA-directed DNA polymerase n=1 Tax=Aphanomyces astaci TaxID=112090 RepID=A0A3R7WAK0_APHAT|nr:hypothetical protein B5M09_003255 [Aphanomyces astaci]
MYATHYCNRDVDVLHKCFEAFRVMFDIRFQIDVYRFMSMPSIAYAIQHNEGCFNGCYSENGTVLGFIRQAIVGGLVMTRDKKKWHTKHQVDDFDAVSLYPSGQSRLPGYVKGKAQLFKDSIPIDADYYIARVRIDSIDKERHFPLLSIQTEFSRNFTNDLVGQTFVIGQQALEDLVEFQQATYTVIEGVYWNEGFSEQIVTTVKSLFAERLKLKDEGNPLQNGIKLLLNSAYGKLIQKPIVKEKLLVKGADKIEEHMSMKIHKIISRTPIVTSTVVDENGKESTQIDLALFEEHKYLYEHYSPAHLGVQILDSSKHIMNEVMCLAEDLDLKIWYQDTDSMHIDRESVEKLSSAFRVKYGRELVGKGLGQFHSDFEAMEGSKGKIYAKESIFLGKKSYLDVLACDGNAVEGQHIRMKGIPSKALAKDTYKTYESLFKSNEKDFNIVEFCPLDINNKTQRVMKRLKFSRKVVFPGEGTTVNKNELSEEEYKLY